MGEKKFSVCKRIHVYMLRLSMSWIRSPNLCQQLTMQECVLNRNLWCFVGISVVYIYMVYLTVMRSQLAHIPSMCVSLTGCPVLQLIFWSLLCFNQNSWYLFKLKWHNFSCHQGCRSWLLNFVCDMVSVLECNRASPISVA